MAKRRRAYIYEYVIVLSIRDGDTFNAEIDMGGRVYKKSAVRLKGVNAPEITSTIPEVAAMARKAKRYLASILPIGSNVRIESKRLDKWSRFESIVTDEHGQIINDLVLTSGNATKAI